jgi:hypothetical protein
MAHQVIPCPHCLKKLKVPDGLLGKQVRCPGCAGSLTAGSAAVETVEAADGRTEGRLTPLPFPAYLGEEPFAFVSYAHKDREAVFAEMARLRDLGCRIWYDEGITPGNEWPEEIGRALERCGFFLVFLSDQAVASRNVRNEINLALHLAKGFLAVHLEETKLSSGLLLQIGTLQAILRHRLPEAEYHRKLTQALPRQIFGSGETQPSQQPTSRKRYEQPISRRTPGCVIFLLCQSDSMKDGIAGSGRSKAEALASTVNRFLSDLITECLKGAATPGHYFDVALIGYRTDAEGRPVVGPAFQGPLEGRDVVSVVDLFEHPLREVVKQVDDGEGGLITRRSYLWYDAVAEGGRPMARGLSRCMEVAMDWISGHDDSFPPVVIHVTDGEPTDGDPEPAAEMLRNLATSDGNVLLFNCHLSDKVGAGGVLFPDNEGQLPDDYARMLFRMSSTLPERTRSIAARKGFDVNAGARGLVFNGDATPVIQLLTSGPVGKQGLR